ncbi:MAG: hypothetical protein O9323_07870, partial [Microcystis sp. LE19-131.1A]|uniref:hypothetical protein n=1 Tax=Microcystis sp. LE19-131.1A TaxID=3016439 RepID=UPI0022C17039
CFLPFAINKSYIFSELSQQKLIFSIGLNNQLSFSCCPLTFSASPNYKYSSNQRDWLRTNGVNSGR